MTGKHILLMMLIIAALVFSSSHREHAFFRTSLEEANIVSLKKTIVAAFIDALHH